MLTTIEGVYRDGRVELSETLEGAEERPILVTDVTRRLWQMDECLGGCLGGCLDGCLDE